MIFVIPIILGAAALGTAVLGVGAGMDGLDKIKEAKERIKKADTRYRIKLSSVEKEVAAVQLLAQEYGQLQFELTFPTISRFISLTEGINWIGEPQSSGNWDVVSVSQATEYKAIACEAGEFLEYVMDIARSAYKAGKCVKSTAIASIALFGTASTGTAISELSGAAAWNATLAWFGGGSLAAGGGGIALGSLVLGGITIAPALAVGGFSLASKGEKDLQKAAVYESELNAETDRLEDLTDVLYQVKRRIRELQNIVRRLNYSSVEKLKELELMSLEEKSVSPKLQQLTLSIQHLVEIIETPVLNVQGNINPANTALIDKHHPSNALNPKIINRERKQLDDFLL